MSQYYTWLDRSLICGIPPTQVRLRNHMIEKPYWTVLCYLHVGWTWALTWPTSSFPLIHFIRLIDWFCKLSREQHGSCRIISKSRLYLRDGATFRFRESRVNLKWQSLWNISLTHRFTLLADRKSPTECKYLPTVIPTSLYASVDRCLGW